MNTPPPGIKALPNGQWVLENDSHLSRWSEEHGTIITDPYLMEWLHPHLEDVKVAWDIGACIGDTTRQYLDWGMKVIAVEPNPLPYACLVHNCPEAHCLQAAASDEVVGASFSQSDNVGASRITPDGDMRVKTVRMDDLLISIPDYVKIDIEGHEVFALRGMEKILRHHKPIIFIEINKGALAANGHSVADISAILLGAGYTQFRTYPEGAMESDEQYDLLAKP